MYKCIVFPNEDAFNLFNNELNALFESVVADFRVKWAGGFLPPCQKHIDENGTRVFVHANAGETEMNAIVSIADNYSASYYDDMPEEFISSQ